MSRDSLPLLSVIVPIYNTEKYLDKCIESIVNQSYQNLEILLIDDGSTDNSGKICDSYAEKDGRIKVYHIENSGVVFVRKLGVSYATGEVLTFVDGDDYIESDMYEQMVGIYVAEQSDMITSGLTMEENNNFFYEIDTIEEGTYDKARIEKSIIPEMMWSDIHGRRAITSSVCNKLYRTSLLRDVIRNVDTTLTIGEDAAITYPFIACSDKITVMKKSWYHYIVRRNSMTREYTLEYFEKLYYFEKCIKQEFEKIHLVEQIKYQIEKYVKMVLKGVIKSVYDIQMETIMYMFPYESIPQGSWIVLYGAGVVGKSYWNCLRNGEYASVVAWVDKNYINERNPQINIENPDNITTKEFDYVMICVEKKSVAESIKRYLLDKNIKEEKIIWVEPRKV